MDLVAWTIIAQICMYVKDVIKYQLIIVAIACLETNCII